MAEWLEELAKEVRERDKIWEINRQLFIRFYSEVSTEIDRLMQEATDFLQQANPLWNYVSDLAEPPVSIGRANWSNYAHWSMRIASHDPHEYILRITVYVTCHTPLNVQISNSESDDKRVIRIISSDEFSSEWLREAVTEALRAELFL